MYEYKNSLIFGHEDLKNVCSKKSPFYKNIISILLYIHVLETNKNSMFPFLNFYKF